ncbi:copper resistance D family protein [Nocardia sp. BMG111209]|uniref:copper resistance D family protein n=1 Tax=Nocardia sp. BMG111209 TaxID=1160137 RepID=UPI00036F4225|nr:CopD family protein [Nocardia sp. BMG111209]
MTGKTTHGGFGARRSALLLVVPAALVGAAWAWMLATPDPVQFEAPIRGLADCAGATVLGLALLPRLQGPGSPPAWRPLAALAGLWAILELVLLGCQAAEVAGVAVIRLGAGQFGTYLTKVSTGQVGIAVLIGTGLIAAYSAAAFRRPGRAAADPVLVFAAVTVTLRPITGHMSQQPFGSLLAAVHALAAAAWFGLLVALAVVIRSRGDWAALLPQYSRWAMPAAIAVTATGVCNALVRLGGLTPLVTTGYGHILLAKTALLVELLVLGWWWRRTWVPRAAAHRVSAEGSLRRAVTEVLAMAIVYGLAATLAVTA